MELNPSMLEEVDLQALGEGGGRSQTTVSSVPHWLPDDLWQAVLALLGFSLPPLEGLEALCPKIIERWEAEPWKGFQTPHRDFALSVKQSLQCMVVFIPLTTSPPSKSLQVCPGTQGGYHAANRWDIVIQPLRSVTLLRGTVIHRGAGGPGRALFIPFAPAGYPSYVDRGAGECNGADEQCCHGLSQLCHLCRCAPPPRTTGSSAAALTLWDSCRGGSSASGATCGPLLLPPT